MALTTAVNLRLAEREQAVEQQRLQAAKKSLAHQLQASSLPGGTAKGDPLHVFRRHDKEGKEGLSLEQFSAAIRRDGKLGHSKITEQEVSQLFASLDTEKVGIVKLDKLSSLAGSGPARKPLGEVTGNGTPTPRDRQRRGKFPGKKAARGSSRARLSKPVDATTEQAATNSFTVATTETTPDTTDVDAAAMLAAAEATVIAREQDEPTRQTSRSDTLLDGRVPVLSVLPSRRSISCIPRKPRPLGTKSGDAAPLEESTQCPPSVEHKTEENETPPVSPVDESPSKYALDATESLAAKDDPEPVRTKREWSSAEHTRFEQALEMQCGNSSPPAEAWAAISAQVGDERTVDEVKAYGMRYLEHLSQEGLDAGAAQYSKQQQMHEAVDARSTSTTEWSQEERGRLAAALDILGPALLSPGSLRSDQASQVWESLAKAVGGGRTAWETRLFAAEWLVRGGGAEQTASKAILSADEAQQEHLEEQTQLIEELVAEHAACEAERREAVQKWVEKEALIAEIVEEHAGVEAERREAVIRAESAESELADAHRAARIVAIDVIARNLAATAIQAQWRKWSAARLLQREIRTAVTHARQLWKKEVDQYAAAQLARVVVSAEASYNKLSTGLLDAQAELPPLREAVVSATARLRVEQEQHGLTKVALRHATTRSQVLEQRLHELSQTLSGDTSANH